MVTRTKGITKVQVQTRIDKEYYDRLKETAKNMEVTTSELTRRIIQNTMGGWQSWK